MSYGLYIHLPFCRGKCPYCGFTSWANADDSMEAYTLAAAGELEMRSQGIFHGNPRTIYIGGGTPSIVPTNQIGSILKKVDPSDVMECTVEANPESLSASWLEGLLDLGVNRLSLGVQALDDRLLGSLGRLHTADRARAALKTAHAAGLNNISIDLMFGIPGQDLAMWKRTLEEVMDTGVRHISAYSLGVEEDTPFFELSRRGGLAMPDPGETADMYSLLGEMMESRGFRRYEISNFAVEGYECLHNRGYWDFSPYLGIGVSAHSFDGTVRRWNTANLTGYIAGCASGEFPPYEEERIDIRARALETIMLSLRTVEGLDLNGFLDRFPVNEENFRSRIGDFQREGLMEEDERGYARLTARGMVVADEIMSELAVEMG